MKTWRELFNQASLERVRAGPLHPQHTSEKSITTKIYFIFLDGPLMVLVEKDIPVFVQSSLYLQSLVSEGSWPTEGLEIPDGCAKKDLTVSNDTDLLELLTTIRFWLVPEVAEEVEDLPRYALMPAEPNNFTKIAKDFERDVPFLAELLAIGSAKDKVYRACNGKIGILKILCEDLNLPSTRAAGLAAASGGHLDCLKYLYPRISMPTHENYNCTCKPGQLECMLFKAERSNWWNMDEAMHAAAGEGQADCVAFLHEHGCAYAYRHMHHAAQHGHLNVMKLLHARNCPWDDGVCSAAAAGGHLECLKFACEHGCPWGDRPPLDDDIDDLSDNVVYAALAAPTVDCLEYLLAQGAYLPPDCFNLVGEKAGVAMFKFLHARGFKPDHLTINHVVLNGGVEEIIYLRKLGVPWPENITAEAAKHRRSDVLLYALQQGCAWDACVLQKAIAMGERGQECVQFMHDSSKIRSAVTIGKRKASC